MSHFCLPALTAVLIAGGALGVAGCGEGGPATVHTAAATSSPATASPSTTASRSTAASGSPRWPSPRPGKGPSATSIVGTWSVYPAPTPGGHSSDQRFIVAVDPGEHTGTWQLGSGCTGTLRLKDISGGYHHFYRIAGGNAGCAPLGVDCLTRDGAQMADVFIAGSGAGFNTYMRRVS